MPSVRRRHSKKSPEDDAVGEQKPVSSDETDYIYGWCTETRRAWRTKLGKGARKEWASKVDMNPGDDSPDALCVSFWPGGVTRPVVDLTNEEYKMMGDLKQDIENKKGVVWAAVYQPTTTKQQMKVMKQKTSGGLAVALYIKAGEAKVDWKTKQLCQLLLKKMPGADEATQFKDAESDLRSDDGRLE